MGEIWVIGGGPSGLMAADEASRAGHRVVVADQMPSVGRKFLMAGKSGLNLTKDDPIDAFAAAYGDGAGPLPGLLARFGPGAVMDWARGLGQPIFTGSTGRVFPVAMKASPLLRAWLANLSDRGVTFRTRWRWTGWQGQSLAFDTPDGRVTADPDATVLALGGASWRRLGSDGAWRDTLSARGVAIAPFAPANAGLRVSWSPHMARHFGQPVKGTALSAGHLQSRGEWTISSRGVEGGGIYEVLRAVREGAALTVDLLPDWSMARVRDRIGQARGSVGNRLRKGLRLDPVRSALLMEWGRPFSDAETLANRAKALPVRHEGPRPLDEAISTAGGVRWQSVGPGLELSGLDGVFAAGEMLDWEAPTGGYLLTGCLATGRVAGRAAARHAAAAQKKS